MIHPEDDNLWYVLGYVTGDYQTCAMYRTTDAGLSWETLYTGGTMRQISFDPEKLDVMYSNDRGKFLKSVDAGETWAIVHDFDDWIETFQISTIDGSIFVLPRWYSSTDPGVYRSVDGGQSWTRFSFGANQKNFIPWDIEEDPNTGILYVVIEIGDHPQPYDPPFYRSIDRGETWEEIGDDLYWHGLSIQVDPLTSDVYYLTEGSGLFKSIDAGLHWERLSPQENFASDLLLDPATPPRLFGTDLLYPPAYEGGVYYSDNGGESFIFLGIEGQMTTDVALNSSSTMLFVVTLEGGIYTAVIPAP
jgi:photosystem II stability/assembly factor-like uncharacterized protein